MNDAGYRQVKLGGSFKLFGAASRYLKLRRDVGRLVQFSSKEKKRKRREKSVLTLLKEAIRGKTHRRRDISYASRKKIDLSRREKSSIHDIIKQRSQYRSRRKRTSLIKRRSRTLN